MRKNLVDFLRMLLKKIQNVPLTIIGVAYMQG
jgi:hypothetical protein